MRVFTMWSEDAAGHGSKMPFPLLGFEKEAFYGWGRRNEVMLRKTDFFPEEDTTKSYSGFEPEPTRLQAEGHSHHTGWATAVLLKKRSLLFQLLALFYNRVQNLSDILRKEAWNYRKRVIAIRTMNNSVEKKNHLDYFTCGRMIGKQEEGCSLTSAAKEFGISKSVVSCTWKAFQTIGIAVRKVGGGAIGKQPMTDI
ncbi:hypothetical protein TNCV_3992811 [Trichonephila clavipes]|uniref:Uncharacterized protein n=1 Tax=Trichonephila clavipes TaxID=2585209 RepID=A0A8X6T4G7_TRICX|nr:hypothetical protein TNCV_3992811 [Trichonephila clavipes]